MPARHGSAAAAPVPQYLPCGHTLQLVLPFSSWYVPAVHTAQAVAPPVEMVPSAHCWGVEDPVVQYDPFGHVVHWLSAPRLVAAVYEPAEHGRATEDPAGQ